MQTVLARTDLRGYYSAPNTPPGNEIVPLRLTVAPKIAGSTIVCQWMVNGEMHQDATFHIFKDGQPSPDGSNGEVFGLRSAGYTAARYDQNEDSTPSNWHILYFGGTTSTAPVAYGLGVRSSSSGNYTFALNRTLSGRIADAYESMVSVGMAQEVAP